MADDNKEIGLDLIFMHPFEVSYMEMAKPTVFGVTYRGKTEYFGDTL